MAIPDLSVVIPTRDRPRRLERTLLALRSCTGLSFEVLVVDDGSGASMTGVVENLGLDYPHEVLWQRAQGQARARNHGTLAARGEWILFLDDDVVSQDGLLEAHCRRLNGSCDASLVLMGLRHSVSSSIWRHAARDDLEVLERHKIADPREAALQGTLWQRYPWAFLATCNASFARRDLIRCGLFDEAYEGWGFEDTDLAYRLSHMDLSFEVLEDPYVLHLDPDSSLPLVDRERGLLPESKLKSYVRNGEYFVAKFSSDETLRALVENDRRRHLQNRPDTSFGAVLLAATAVRSRPLPAPTVPERLSLLSPLAPKDQS
tara:strand:- start:5365 stop:6318 length:954 start_codon:yes stop_codon:yes gene_type:complete